MTTITLTNPAGRPRRHAILIGYRGTASHCRRTTLRTNGCRPPRTATHWVRGLPLSAGARLSTSTTAAVLLDGSSTAYQVALLTAKQLERAKPTTM